MKLVPTHRFTSGFHVGPVQVIRGAAVVRPVGEVDAASAPELRRAMETALAGHQPLLLVDVSGVTFLDSAGLAVLIGAHRDLAPGQEMALAQVPARMRRVLEVAGVEQIMTVHSGDEPWPWPDIPRH